jgi:hypothetical protein
VLALLGAAVMVENAPRCCNDDMVDIEIDDVRVWCCVWCDRMENCRMQKLSVLVEHGFRVPPPPTSIPSAGRSRLW